MAMRTETTGRRIVVLPLCGLSRVQNRNLREGRLTSDTSSSDDIRASSMPYAAAPVGRGVTRERPQYRVEIGKDSDTVFTKSSLVGWLTFALTRPTIPAWTAAASC